MNTPRICRVYSTLAPDQAENRSSEVTNQFLPYLYMIAIWMTVGKFADYLIKLDNK